MTSRLDSTVGIATALPRSVRPSRWRAIRQLLATPGAIFGISWLLLLIIASFTAPLWAPYGPNEQTESAPLSGPSAAHWLGTDDLGRDVLTRIFTASATNAARAEVVMASADRKSTRLNSSHVF